MNEITLVRQDVMAIAEADRAVVRRVVFGAIDGLGDKGRKQWRRFFNGLLRLEPGEMVSIKTHKPRCGVFHREHMLIETRVFEAQERFDNFEQFRNWLKVGAGFCDWLPGPKGAVIPVPKSIAFDKLDDEAMRQVHDDMIAFLRSGHAAKVLWRHLPDAARADRVEAVLAHFAQGVLRA